MQRAGIRRVSLALIALALASLAVAVFWKLGREKPEAQMASEPLVACEPLVVPARELTNADRLAAMLSVHGHAYRAAGIFPSKAALFDLKLLPLEAAAEILSADQNAGASSRRRRAVAKLVAYGQDDPELTLRWRQLLKCDPSRIRTIGAVLAAKRGATLPETESAVYDTLGANGPSQCTDASFGGPVWDEAGVAFQLSLTVEQRSVDQVAPLLDPQAWDDGSSLFVDTYLTTDPGQASDCDPVTADPADPAPNNPQPLGSAYSGALFEHYRCDPCTTEFKNMLGITTIRDKGSCDSGANPCTTSSIPYQACFTLGADDALQACTGSVRIHLEHDQGALTACRTPAGGARVTSRKELQFEEQTVSAATYWQLALGQAEATESLAEVVGCDLP